jgi:hypothetical protein
MSADRHSSGVGALVSLASRSSVLKEAMRHFVHDRVDTNQHGSNTSNACWLFAELEPEAFSRHCESIARLSTYCGGDSYRSWRQGTERSWSGRVSYSCRPFPCTISSRARIPTEDAHCRWTKFRGQPRLTQPTLTMSSREISIGISSQQHQSVQDLVSNQELPVPLSKPHLLQPESQKCSSSV